MSPLTVAPYDLKICKNSRKYISVNTFDENYFGSCKIISLNER